MSNSAKQRRAKGSVQVSLVSATIVVGLNSLPINERLLRAVTDPASKPSREVEEEVRAVFRNALNRSAELLCGVRSFEKHLKNPTAEKLVGVLYISLRMRWMVQHQKKRVASSVTDALMNQVWQAGKMVPVIRKKLKHLYGLEDGDKEVEKWKADARQAALRMWRDRNADAQDTKQLARTVADEACKTLSDLFGL